MIVENKDGKGNPYHSDKTGRFVSKSVMETKKDIDSDDIDDSVFDEEISDEELDKLFSDDDFDIKDFSDLFVDEDFDINDFADLFFDPKDHSEINSLRNFAEASKNRIHKFIDDDGERILSPELKQKYDAHFKEIVDNSLLTRYFKSKRLLSILESDCLANQLETGFAGEGACTSKKTRTDFSIKAFGSKFPKGYIGHSGYTGIYDMVRSKGFKYLLEGGYKELSQEEQDYFLAAHGCEKYGCLENNDIRALSRNINSGSGSSYGNMICVFKKSTMFDRTTYTIGDSLNIKGEGEPAFLSEGFNPYAMEAYTFHRYDDGDFLNTSLKDIQKSWCRYLELQFHGEIKPSRDIESIISTWDFWHSIDGKKCIEYMQKSGIKAYCSTRSGNLVSLTLEGDTLKVNRE